MTPLATVPFIFDNLTQRFMNIPQRLVQNIQTVLLGKEDKIKLAVACFLGGGHLLIDDIPGVGKTTLALAMAKSIGSSFQRIQFTSDLLPSDVIGVSILQSTARDFEFKPGPIFHNIVLADEINRASPKTQSALLEAMQEGQVSVDNRTHDLPQPFFVIATQNPHEHHGTFPLPESQLDRFMMRIDLGYPDEKSEGEILKGESRGEKIHHLSTVAGIDDMKSEIANVNSVVVDDSIDQYILAIAASSRRAPLVDLGLSPRGSLALKHAAQGLACVEGRTFVIPDDVKRVAVPVMAHRMRVKGGHFQGHSSRVADNVVQEILNQIPVPL